MVAGDKPGQERSRSTQPAVEAGPGSQGGNQDDTGSGRNKPELDVQSGPGSPLYTGAEQVRPSKSTASSE